MKRMLNTRRSTLVGLLGGLVVLIAMIATTHQQVVSLFNLPGLMMVVGGTLMATLVSRPAGDVWRALRSLRDLLNDEVIDVDRELTPLMDVAYWYRNGRIADAEQALAQIENPLLRNGAQMVLDREPVEHVVKVLQWRMAGERNREQGDAQILRTMALFAPAFGMLGTLFGLVQMLSGLGEAGLAQIGSTMSFALITTLYGLVLANMVFKPLAIKMEQRTQHRLTLMNVIVEGVVLLHERRHPSLIKEALTAYLFQQKVPVRAPAGLPQAA